MDLIYTQPLRTFAGLGFRVSTSNSAQQCDIIVVIETCLWEDENRSEVPLIY